jgi:radical SAM superfamily enzyme YgiQ (UPF0313 family)
MMAYVAAAGFTSSILCEYADRPLTKARIRKELRATHPRLVGFSCYQVTMDRVRLWARYIKQLDPRITIVLGGPQIQFMPGQALADLPEIDALCRGEGEVVLLDLCKTLTGGGTLLDVRGICCRRGDTAFDTPASPSPLSLDQYPSPYTSGTIDVSNVKKAILLTSRGCNWNCHFCYTPNASGRKVRFHSVDHIIEEMRFLKAAGVTYFWIGDPLFSADPAHLKNLLNRMIAEVPGVTFWCEGRCESLTEELFDLMKRAGAVKIAFGLESGSSQVLGTLNKRLALSRLSRAVRLAQAVAIEVELYSIFGLPGETFADAMDTIDYVKSHDVRISGNSGSQQLSVYFGTEFQWRPHNYGIVPNGVTKPSYKSIGRDYATDRLTPDDLTRIGLVWKLHELEHTPPNQAVFSLGELLRHTDALSDQAVFHYVLFNAYLALHEYGLACQAFRALQTRFPGSEYLERIQSNVSDVQQLEARVPAVYPPRLVTAAVREQDELLFYAALRSMPLKSVARDSSLTVVLLDYYLAFGLTDRATALIEAAPRRSRVGLAKVCADRSYPELALRLLHTLKRRTAAARLVEADSLLQLDKLDAVDAELSKVREGDTVRRYELWLDCVSRLRRPGPTYMACVNKLLDAQLAQMR